MNLLPPLEIDRVFVPSNYDGDVSGLWAAEGERVAPAGAEVRSFVLCGGEKGLNKCAIRIICEVYVRRP